MKILMIDDSEYKIDIAKTYLPNHRIETAGSYNKGMRMLMKNKYDGLILDMGFPTYENGNDIDSKKGLLVLSEMERLGLKVPTMVYSTTTDDSTFSYENVLFQLYFDYTLEQSFERFIEECKDN